MESVKDMQTKLANNAEELTRLEAVIAKLSNEIKQRDDHIKQLTFELQTLKNKLDKHSLQKGKDNNRNSPERSPCKHNGTKTQLSSPICFDLSKESRKEGEGTYKQMVRVLDIIMQNNRELVRFIFEFISFHKKCLKLCCSRFSRIRKFL